MNAKEMPGGVEVMPSWIGPRDKAAFIIILVRCFHHVLVFEMSPPFLNK